MWEKISDYCLDISKYFLTAVFAAALLDDLGDNHWVFYTLCGLLGGGLFAVGLFFNKMSDKEKDQKRRRYRKYNINKKRKE